MPNDAANRSVPSLRSQHDSRSGWFGVPLLACAAAIAAAITGPAGCADRPVAISNSAPSAASSSSAPPRRELYYTQSQTLELVNNLPLQTGRFDKRGLRLSLDIKRTQYAPFDTLRGWGHVQSINLSPMDVYGLQFRCDGQVQTLQVKRVARGSGRFAGPNGELGFDETFEWFVTGDQLSAIAKDEGASVRIIGTRDSTGWFSVSDLAQGAMRKALRLSSLEQNGSATAMNGVLPSPSAPPQPKSDPAPGAPTIRYVMSESAVERYVTQGVAPEASVSETNTLYKGQRVEVYETVDGWARVSTYYDRRVEQSTLKIKGEPVTVARWVEVKSLGAERPAPATSLNIPDDPRFSSLPRASDNGLDERDVLILHAAARYYLETGKAARIDGGDKSVTKPGMYYLMEGPQNKFFRPSDIPDLEKVIQALVTK